MKFLALLFVISWLVVSSTSAQTPQFAVVKPNGTSFVYSSWDLAYAGASNDDFIYLPGTTITTTITINKRIHVYGAGHFPDSTVATGKTNISGNLLVTSGASGGSIEGIRFFGYVSLGGVTKLQNYSLSKCYLPNALIFVNQNNDSVPEFCTVSENILSNIQSSNSSYSTKNNLFNKNVFLSSTAVANTNLCLFSNNIFLNQSNVIYFMVTNSTFQNNIFLSANPVNLSGGNGNCYNSFLNNLKFLNSSFDDLPSCPNQAEENNISVSSIDSIFISYISSWDYEDNLHLTSSCPGVGAGTDGTDVGIYGTNNPTPTGWVPRNPHIYFKQVDSETGSDGKLHIQVGVRANNN